MSTVLIIPGRGGSGEGHWQSHLERAIPSSVRVHQDDWEEPDIALWARRIDAQARQCDSPPLAVAHSFGCLALAYAVRAHATPLAASFLVAPADPQRFAIADAAVMHPLGQRSDLLASSNDPWLSDERCRQLGAAWGSRLHVLGPLGHINIDSGFGPWPQMLAWVQAGEVDCAGRPLSGRGAALAAKDGVGAPFA